MPFILPRSTEKRDLIFVERLKKQGKEIFLTGAAHADGILKGLKENGLLDTTIFVYAYGKSGMDIPYTEQMRRLSIENGINIFVREIEPDEKEKMDQLVQEILVFSPNSQNPHIPGI